MFGLGYLQSHVIQSTLHITYHTSHITHYKSHLSNFLLVSLNSPGKKTLFFSFFWQFYSLYEQKFPTLRPHCSITFSQGFQISKKLGHWTSGSGGKKTFNRSEQMKKIRKKLFVDAPFLHPLRAKVFKSETTSYHYFSPKIQNI